MNFDRELLGAPAVGALASTEGLGAWLPIETAPATRTMLVWHREYEAVTAHILVGDLWGVYMPGVPMLFQKHLTPSPTHWMPLPDAPSSLQPPK